MFSQASVILFTAGMYMAGGHAWQGGGMHSGGTCVTFNERFILYFKLMYQGPMFQLKVGMLD